MTQTVLLGDIGKVITGKTPPKANPEYWGSEMDFITPTDFSDSKYISPKRQLSSEGKQALHRIVCPTNSVIVTCIGSDMGKVALAKSDYISNQQINSLVIDKEKADPNFIYYLLKLNRPLLRKYAESGGSTMPIINKSTFEKLAFAMPNLETQKKIANILSTIDEKIELNRKMNETLEQMGQALFRHYFIDNPEVLKWGIVRIGDIAEVTDYVANGSFASLKANVTLYDSPEYALFVRTTDFKSGFSGNLKYTDKKSYDFLKKSVLRGREFIISNVGDTGTVFRPPAWINRPMTLGSNAIMLKDSEFNRYLYQYFRSSEGQFAISNIVAGSAQPKFNKTEFRNLKVNKPDLTTLNEFNEKFGLIEQNITANIAQIQTLTTLRDALLPRLINGKAKV